MSESRQTTLTDNYHIGLWTESIDPWYMGEGVVGSQKLWHFYWVLSNISESSSLIIFHGSITEIPSLGWE